MTDEIYIEGQSSGLLTLAAATANKTGGLSGGTYDCYCDTDCFIKVAPTGAASVTVNNGYKIFAGNVVPVIVSDGKCIEAISVAGGAFKYQKVG